MLHNEERRALRAREKRISVACPLETNPLISWEMQNKMVQVRGKMTAEGYILFVKIE